MPLIVRLMPPTQPQAAYKYLNELKWIRNSIRRSENIFFHRTKYQLETTMEGY